MDFENQFNFRFHYEHCTISVCITIIRCNFSVYHTIFEKMVLNFHSCFFVFLFFCQKTQHFCLLILGEGIPSIYLSYNIEDTKYPYTSSFSWSILDQLVSESFDL